MRGHDAGLFLAIIPVLAVIGAAAASAAQSAPVQLLPLPGLIAPAPSTPAPLAPPINPGYAATPPNGLSPLLTQPGPVYQPLPPNAGPSYPAQQLPGPIDQQKLQSYRNDLRGQQWQLQRQGTALSGQRGQEIQQHLNAPDPQ